MTKREDQEFRPPLGGHGGGIGGGIGHGPGGIGGPGYWTRTRRYWRPGGIGGMDPEVRDTSPAALEAQVTSLVDPAISQEVLDIFPVAQATFMAADLTMCCRG
jgi:hypothetical protein